MAQVWLVTGSSRGLGRAIVEAGLAAGNQRFRIFARRRLATSFSFPRWAEESDLQDVGPIRLRKGASKVFPKCCHAKWRR